MVPPVYILCNPPPNHGSRPTTKSEYAANNIPCVPQVHYPAFPDILVTIKKSIKLSVNFLSNDGPTQNREIISSLHHHVQISIFEKRPCQPMYTPGWDSPGDDQHGRVYRTVGAPV